MMIESVAAKQITTAILVPILKGVFDMSKKFGVKGLNKWGEAKYFSKIQKKISSIENLKTFWSADKEINLTDFYYPSRIAIDGVSSNFEYLSDLPSGNLVLEGIVGQGKSIYLRHLATSDIRSNQAKIFPIFIEFRTISVKVDLQSAIKNFLDEINIDAYEDLTFDFIMNSGKFILLLDAFDEIEDGLVKGVYLEIDRLLEKYENLRIIITSRPFAEIQKSPKFTTIKLLDLRESDYISFLSKLGLAADFVSEIKHQIAISPSNISELIKTPLMLTLVVIAYRSVNKIPENLPDFFEILFRCVFSGHDNAKPAFHRKFSTGLSEGKLQELFEAFCFICLNDKITRSLTTTQFNDAFLQASKIVEKASCESASFRSDMCKVACLILPDGYENWVFLHKSIMEYYAASFVKKSNEEFAKKFYDHAMKNPQPWMEVLIFLNYIDDYRFNKYYLLEEIKLMKNEFSFLQESDAIDSLLKYLDPVDINFNFEYIEGVPYGFRAVSVSWGGFFPKYCFRNLTNQIFESFFSFVFENVPDDSKFLEFLFFRKSETDRSSISLRQLINFIGGQELVREFKIMMEKVEEKKSKALINIEIHESRINIIF